VKKSRFTEEQIAFALTQADSGTSVEEVIRRMGVSEQACRTSASTQTGSCRWPMLGARSRHGGGMAAAGQ
jgi:putative transposase